MQNNKSKLCRGNGKVSRCLIKGCDKDAISAAAIVAHREGVQFTLQLPFCVAHAKAKMNADTYKFWMAERNRMMN